MRVPPDSPGSTPGQAIAGRRPHSRPAGRARRLLPVVALALLVPLGSACAAAVDGQASRDGNEVPVTGTAAASTAPRSDTTVPRTTTPSASTSATSASARPGHGSATTPSSPTRPSTTRPTTTASAAAGPAPTGAAWTWVLPAGLQDWEVLADDGTTVVRRSGDCLLALSAMSDLPSMTDMDLARQHLRLVANAYQHALLPQATPAGQYVSTSTDPVRLGDPTKTAPPAVHLQLSGFHNVIPDLSVTDQTYAFATSGGGQGLAVSTACTDAAFAARYDSEIAPLIGDLGVDTGL